MSASKFSSNLKVAKFFVTSSVNKLKPYNALKCFFVDTHVTVNNIDQRLIRFFSKVKAKALR